MARIVCALPVQARWWCGRKLGLLALQFAAKRRNVVKTNLQLCFPDLNDAEIHSLLVRNFESSGISIFETAKAWFADAQTFLDTVDIQGLDNLKAAHAQGDGVIMLGMHLSTLDYCGAALVQHYPFDVMYRKNKNKLLEAIMTRGRDKNFDSSIERDDVRQVVRRLKQGAVVWYGPDQDYGLKHSIFAPFFGQPAATITATARIARITKSPVVIVTYYRDEQTHRYRMELTTPLEDYPGNDELENCTRINRIIEQSIMKAPEQYWWLHRRFKTQPDGKSKLYTT